MNSKMRDIRGNRKGSMPFSIIAVTLLIMSSTFVVVCSQMDRAEEATIEASVEMDNLGDAVAEVEDFVKRGLGEIIYDISVNGKGDLSQRIAEFDERSETWLNIQFPVVAHGIVADLIDHDIQVGIESLKSGDGYLPSYIVATATFTARYSSSFTESVRESCVETDATYALPLSVEQGSLFKNALNGNGSLISQMVTYQLSNLAQIRVLNGYGALNIYGDKGTASIITKDDVATAYNNAINVLSLTYFHGCEDDVLGSMELVDLSDYISVTDGMVSVDLSAVYAQAIISVADDLALQWVQYLGSDYLVKLADKLDDIAKNVKDSIVSFFTKKDVFSAVPYINKVLSDSDIDMNMVYRMYSGMNATFEYDINFHGEYKEMEISIPYPQVNLPKYDGIKNFTKHYRDAHNFLVDSFREAIVTAAMNLADKKALGAIAIPLDMTDDESAIKTVTSAIEERLLKGDEAVKSQITESIGNGKVYDPFYFAIYDTVYENRDKIYGISAMKDNMFGEVLRSVYINIYGEKYLKSTYSNTNPFKGMSPEKALENLCPTDMDIYVIACNIMEKSEEPQRIYDEYVSDVDLIISEMERLNTVLANNNDSIIKTLCRGAAEIGLDIATYIVDVPEQVIGICQEASENVAVNSYGGVITLPGIDHFVAIDDDGRTYREYLDVKIVSAPRIEIVSALKNDDNMHYIGFNEDSCASYCAMFRIIIKDDLRFTIDGSNGMGLASGVINSCYEDGCNIDVTMDIPVISGWALFGVTYRASNTLIGDIWTGFLKIIEPIIEPLRKVLDMILDALEVLNSALLEMSKYVAEIVERLYTSIMEPLEELKKIIEDTLEQWASEAADSIFEWLININMNRQKIGFTFMGFTLMITLNLASLEKSTKTLFTVSLGTKVGDYDVEGHLTLKQKGEGKSKEMIFYGGASVKGNNWDVSADLDPLMKNGNYMISMSGSVNGIGMDLVLPTLVSYCETDLSLQDIPGLREVLSNIPIGGVKLSIDLGLKLKYTVGIKHGLVINEFESNPEGQDSGNEWVELYNGGSSTVDLDGYELRAGSSKKSMELSGSIGPRGKLVVNLPGTFLNNTSNSKLKSGEYVELIDDNGNTVDKTPAKKDTSNDSYTWQRIVDGSTEWTFQEGTPGEKNCGGMITGTMAKSVLKKLLRDSVEITFGDMGTLTSPEDVSAFFRNVMQNMVDSAIDMLADCLVEASVYVSVDATDVTSSTCTGTTVYVSIDSGFVGDSLRCIVGYVEEILFGLDNPYNISMKDAVMDNTYLGVKIYTGLNLSKVLKKDAMDTKACIDIKTNMSAIDRLLGGSQTHWKVSARLGVEDCPYALIPSGMKADRDMNNDLWLISVTFRSA